MQNIEDIYVKYSQTVYKYIFCLTGDKELSEEILQETFLVAVKDINKFKGQCKITSWLCQIAKYIWYKKLKHIKKNKEISIEEIDTEISGEHSLEEDICDKEERLQVFKKIQKLDETTRNVMYLRILGDLEYEEIAEIMNKTSSWARVTFFRGKQKLKEEE